jgi:hypothetical protein
MVFTGNQAILFFILHLVGDYLLQTDWMASNKRKDWLAALIHAGVYCIPFCLVFNVSHAAAALMFLSHAVIDHYALARYVVFAKNWINQPSLRWRECKETGYHWRIPTHISIWLLIIADNTLHLIINYIALTYL